MADTPCVLFMTCTSSSLGVPVGNDLHISATFKAILPQVFNTNSFPTGGYDFNQIVALLQSNVPVWITGGGGGQGWQILVNGSNLPSIGSDPGSGQQTMTCTLIDVNRYSFIADANNNNGIPVVFNPTNPIYYASVQFGPDGHPIFTNSYNLYSMLMI